MTLHNDPGCPWGYSANPHLAVMRWRYGAGLNWRLVMIGLSEDAESYERAGYTPVRMAKGHLGFRRRFGMPFAAVPKARATATGRACRAIVATRLADPAKEWAAMRALQFAWFCTDELLDTDAGIRNALATVEGLDADAIIRSIGDPAVEEAYQADRAEARTAEGGPTHAQGKAAARDGAVRYTAPSLVLRDGDRVLEAGGFQSIEAYDVVVANLDPTLKRNPTPENALAALQAFDHGLTTQEVTALRTAPLVEPDREATEGELLELVADGRVRRVPLGDDALWRAV